MLHDVYAYYEVLGLDSSASRDQIRQAYRDLARVWHPDRFSHDRRLQRKAEEQLKLINEAYEVLTGRRPEPRIPGSRAKPRPSPTDESAATSEQQSSTRAVRSEGWRFGPLAGVCALVVIGLVTLYSRQVPAPVAVAERSPGTTSLTYSDWKRYSSVYDDPHVRHLRIALDNYLSGNSDGINSVAINAGTNGNSPSGLDAFPKELYRSKFIVLALDASIVGGKEVAVVFRSHPQQAYTAWICRFGDRSYELSGFWVNDAFTLVIDRLIAQYRDIFADPDHGL